MKEYKLFISHSWRYSKQYDGLRRLLDSYQGFEYSDYSVPKSDPFDTMSDRQLEEELREQMAQLAALSFWQAFTLVGVGG